MLNLLLVGFISFFVASECIVYKKSPPCGRACFEIASRNDYFQRDSIDVQDFIYGSGVLSQPW